MGRAVKTETPIFRFEEGFGDGAFFDDESGEAAKVAGL